ncbi:MAG: Fatty acid hydroxylase superfamily protein [Acidobacteriales bacterium]|nr:Fatty acid hydroxylase superfamily protein [Terriglobales bacterium]
MSPEATQDPALRAFGSGWISGVFSVLLGGMGLFAVFCLLFPSLLTVPEARALYPMPYIRALIHVGLVSGFLFGVICICLRKWRVLGIIGVACTLIAALLGGSQVPIEGELSNGPYLGLDWFLLNLIFFSAVFVPMERLFARHPEQAIFRQGWRTDIIYFLMSNLLVGFTTLLTMKPAMVLFSWAVSAQFQSAVRSQPVVLQFLEVILIADLFQYWVHRSFHTWPSLWRFHAVHHSAEAMDWLAGSRLHLVDAVATRAIIFLPFYVLGFSQAALLAYVIVVSLQATFIHANVRFNFGPLRLLFATPQFHHWHHGADAEAIDKNFAVHLPALDLLFGTFHMPKGEWPHAYGITNNPVPEGYLKQMVYPFRKKN